MIEVRGDLREQCIWRDNKGLLQVTIRFIRLLRHPKARKKSSLSQSLSEIIHKSGIVFVSKKAEENTQSVSILACSLTKEFNQEFCFFPQPKSCRKIIFDEQINLRQEKLKFPQMNFQKRWCTKLMDKNTGRGYLISVLQKYEYTVLEIRNWTPPM